MTNRVEFDAIDVLLKRAGGDFQPHKSVRSAPWMADYGCRRCWRTMEGHDNDTGAVCDLGPNCIAVHKSCCPVCSNEEI